MNYVWMSPTRRFKTAGILACVFALCTGVLIQYRLPYTLSMPVLPCLSVKAQQDSFREKLALTAQRNYEALARIKSDFEIPDHQWNIMQTQLHGLKKHDDLFNKYIDYQVDHPFKQMVTRIASDYGMNPNVINIRFIKDRKIDVQTRQPIIDGMVMHVLEVNLDWIQKYPLITQEAFVRHELMHLYNYDSAQNNLLYQLLDDTGHKSEDFLKHPAIVNWNHQLELRADLLACCKSPEVTYAFKYDFNRDISQVLGEWVSNTHPSPQKRFDQLEALLQEMHANAPKLA